MRSSWPCGCVNLCEFALSRFGWFGWFGWFGRHAVGWLCFYCTLDLDVNSGCWRGWDLGGGAPQYHPTRQQVKPFSTLFAPSPLAFVGPGRRPPPLYRFSLHTSLHTRAPPPPPPPHTHTHLVVVHSADTHAAQPPLAQQLTELEHLWRFETSGGDLEGFTVMVF